MRVMTIFGTRPEIIRLSRIIPKLDQHCEHITIHTGQNYDPGLSDVFFEELSVRTPDRYLGVKEGSFGAQIGRILEESESVLNEFQPDKVLILGDTNSALSAIIAARLGIPVFHMEAGNRCFDDRVPEEVNRRIIDHSSSVLLPYTERSKENLVDEGVPRERIYVTGNPINEVLEHFRSRIDASGVKAEHEVSDGDYFLVTIHRAENVDDRSRLAEILRGLEEISVEYGKPALVSLHPRTASKLEEFGLKVDKKKVRLLKPLGFFDFVHLERGAFCVLTDSGTVQEECSIFGVPNVTVRDVTERPETLECGSNIISGAGSESILRSVEIAVNSEISWSPPAGYLATGVSETVVKIVLGYTSLRRHISK